MSPALRSHAPPCLGTLVDRLEASGHAVDRTAVGALVAERRAHDDMPLYLRLLAGTGAFIASIFFVSFLFAADLLDPDTPWQAMAWGAAFIVFAVGLKRLSDGKGEGLADALTVASFSLMATGKGLAVGGLAMEMDSEWGVTLGLLAVTGVTYPLYRISVDRYLSSLALFASLFVTLLHGGGLAAELREPLFHLATAATLAGALGLSLSARAGRTTAPLAYALWTTAAGAAMLVVAQTTHRLDLPEVAVWPVTALLGLSLMTVIAWAAGRREALARPPVLVALGGAVGLSAVSSPGLVLAVTLMVLGYARHDRLMTAFGVLFVPLFLFHLYYSLDLGLLEKSALLTASGGLLLLGRWLLARLGWDGARKEVRP